MPFSRTKIGAAATIFALLTSPTFAQFKIFRELNPTAKALDSVQLKVIKEKLLNSGITIKDGPSPSPAPPPIPQNATRLEELEAASRKTITPLEAARQRISEQFDPKIVGGTPAEIEDFPWQVVLIAGNTPTEIRSAFCGGSIIGSQWILTAAHCLYGISNPKDVDIVSGSSYPKFPGQGDRVDVSHLIIHPKYNHETFENDIALLRLKRPIKRGKAIKLAPSDLDIPINALATVSGWGAVTAYSAMVDRLLKTDVPIVANNTCNTPDSYANTVKAGMLCAGYRDGGYDACQGDSGGPLMARVNGVPTQVGIVSWGRGCALKLKYGVYTRVTNYSEWVNIETSKPRLALR